MTGKIDIARFSSGRAANRLRRELLEHKENKRGIEILDSRSALGAGRHAGLDPASMNTEVRG
jgi:hypothetical protein